MKIRNIIDALKKVNKHFSNTVNTAFNWFFLKKLKKTYDDKFLRGKGGSRQSWTILALSET